MQANTTYEGVLAPSADHATLTNSTYDSGASVGGDGHVTLASEARAGDGDGDGAMQKESMIFDDPSKMYERVHACGPVSYY